MLAAAGSRSSRPLPAAGPSRLRGAAAVAAGVLWSIAGHADQPCRAQHAQAVGSASLRRAGHRAVSVPSPSRPVLPHDSFIPQPAQAPAASQSRLSVLPPRSQTVPPQGQQWHPTASSEPSVVPPQG